MNLLSVGTERAGIREHLNKPFLIVDPGPVIDTIPLEEGDVLIDLSRHSFNPVKDIDPNTTEGYKQACDNLAVLEAAYPKGPDTITKQNSGFVLLEAMLSRPKSFAELLPEPGPKEKDTGVLDAYRTTQALLLSPVLNRFLCNPAHHTNFSLTGTVLVRLDPFELVRSDRFVIANLLIAAYQGQVVITDFGTYGGLFHRDLIDQERLITCVNSLDEVPEMRSHLLRMKAKIAQHCLYEDAVTLAEHAGLAPDFTRDDNDYNRYIRKAIRLTN